MITREQAAAVRGPAVGKSLGDRPRERRAEIGGGHGRTSPWASQIRISEPGDGPLTFDGFASVTEQGYEMWDMYGPYTEVIDLAAFDVTLAQSDLSVPFVVAHDAIRVMARTDSTGDVGKLTLTAVKDGEQTGLHALATNLDGDDGDVAYMLPKWRSGLVREMSFRFTITSGQWSPDYMEYRIKGVDLHRGDVCTCTYGANPYTDGAGLRSEERPAVVRQPENDLALREALADLVRA